MDKSSKVDGSNAGRGERPNKQNRRGSQSTIQAAATT
jgi:hypothetical protein